MTTNEKKRKRVIIHLDLDCFYAQVEQRRLNIPDGEPIAVQQWGTLLAVNYAARKFGVKRGEFWQDAIKKCPSIHLPHVDTLGENRRPGEVFDRKHQKVILRRYRVASREIFQILSRLAPIYEKASIDEAFLDVTKHAYTRLAKMEVLPSDFCDDVANADTKVFGVCAMEGIGKDIEVNTLSGFPITEEEQLLCIGAVIAREIRQEIWDKLRYTCSTGIASNKLVAKLASPLNKPNGQTLIAPRFIPVLMQHFPLRNIRGLGGKLGHQMEEIFHLLGSQIPNQFCLQGDQVTPPVEKPKVTAQEFIERCSVDDLAKHVGRDTAVLVHRVCRGDDGDDPVNNKMQAVKAFSSIKQFDRQSGDAVEWIEELEYWTRVISEEIILRCEDERIENKRFPTQLTIHYARVGEKPKSRKLPLAQDTTKEELYAAAMNVLRREVHHIFPCSHLTMHAKDFVLLDSRAPSSISSFFTKQQTLNGADTIHPMEAQLQQLTSSIQQSSHGSSKRKISSFFSAYSNNSTNSSDSEPSMKPLVTTHVRLDEDNDDVLPRTSTNVTVLSDNTLEADHRSSATSFYCKDCKIVITEPRAEHDDFHFALKLSRTEQQHLQSNQDSRASKKLKKSGPLDAFLTR